MLCFTLFKMNLSIIFHHHVLFSPSDGPVEFRQKSSQLIRSTRPFFSTPEENTSATNSPAIVDSPTISSFRSQNLPKSSPSKLLCRHCKSHNMPEYLYTCESILSMFYSFFFDTWYYFCFRIKLIRCTMKMANCFARYWKNVIVSTAAVQSHENCFRMTKLNLTNVSPIIFDLNEHFLWAYLIKGKSFLLSFVFGFVFKLK